VDKLGSTAELNMAHVYAAGHQVTLNVLATLQAELEGESDRLVWLFKGLYVIHSSRPPMTFTKSSCLSNNNE
jgi:hypothetical protein